MRIHLLLGFAVLASCLYAVDEPARFALVIGNAQYDGDAALTNPANDATDMANALASIGWQVTKVIDGDRKTMNRAVAEFRNSLTIVENPTALLYYAGHGVQINGQNYLLPVKEDFATADDVVADAISLQFILNTFSEARVSTDIIILDACRDNPFEKKSNRSLGGTRGLTVVNKSSTAEGSVVMFSTAPGDTAADGSGRNGIFTQALLKYITTGLKLQDVATRVTGEVKRLTGGKQVPYNSISLSDDFYMVPASLRSGDSSVAEEAVPVVTPRLIGPSVPESVNIKASLIVERQTLTKQKTAMKTQGAWVGWMGIGGWVTSAGGAGLMAYEYYLGVKALEDYSSFMTYDVAVSSRERIMAANTGYKVGMGIGIGGLSLVVLSWLLSPDLQGIETKIRDVEEKITLLDANRL